MKQADMPHVQPLVVVQLLVLLGLANGTPVIAKKILGTILARPLDGGMNLADGQPLFGDSKPFAASCSLSSWWRRDLC